MKPEFNLIDFVGKLTVIIKDDDDKETTYETIIENNFIILRKSSFYPFHNLRIISKDGKPSSVLKLEKTPTGYNLYDLESIRQIVFSCYNFKEKFTRDFEYELTRHGDLTDGKLCYEAHEISESIKVGWRNGILGFQNGNSFSRKSDVEYEAFLKLVTKLKTPKFVNFC